MEVVRNEFVIAFQFVIGHIEENSPILELGTLFQDSDGTLVPLQQGWKARSHKWFFNDLGERFGGPLHRLMLA